MFEVLIVIISYNSADDIVRCMAALEQLSYTTFRVVVCENAGAVAFDTLRKELPSHLPGGQTVEAVLAPYNLGYAGGINFALDHVAKADAYWVLNPDVEPSPLILEAMVERLGRHDCQAVGHDLVLPNGKLASRGGGQWRSWSARPISIDHGRSPTVRVHPEVTEAKLDYVIGASMLISQDFLNLVGRMREDYFLYCEEIEWCLRATRLGQRLGYAPAGFAVHRHGTSTGGGGALSSRSKLAVYLNERNRMLLTRDVYPARFPVALVLSLLHIVLKYVRSRAWRQLGYALSGWTAGVRNERGRPAWWNAG